MRNINLNILKFLESIDSFCLYLLHIGLGVSYQLSVISYQLSVISSLRKLPTPHTPHTTPCPLMPREFQ
ncbi:MAG: hypothetical protein GPJ10_00055 [Microcystis aeruginosa L211-07]|nr:hypothetical protein [Microcystis aeruginosa L211-07]